MFPFTGLVLKNFKAIYFMLCLFILCSETIVLLNLSGVLVLDKMCMICQ